MPDHLFDRDVKLDRPVTTSFPAGAVAANGVGVFRAPEGLVVWRWGAAAPGVPNGSTIYETVLDGRLYELTRPDVLSQRGSATIAGKWLRELVGAFNVAGAA